MSRILFVALILLALLCSKQVHAQLQGQPLIDSLLKELPKLKEDTNKVKALNSLSYGYPSIDPDEGIRYGQQGFVLAGILHWKTGMAKADQYIGTNYSFKSNYPKALEYALKALKIYEETGDKRGLASVTGSIGNVYLFQGDYPPALEYYLKALKINEETGNKGNEAAITGNIGMVYANLGNYPKALEYYFKALKMHEELGDKDGVANVTGSIGTVYNDQGYYPQALEYYFKALKIREELGDKRGVAAETANIGMVYSDQGEYPEALEYYFKALKMNEETGNKVYQATITGNIGLIYDDRGDYPRALEYYFKALKIYEELEDKDGAARVLGDIGSIYTKQKKYIMAIALGQRAVKMHEETLNKRRAAYELAGIGDAYLSLAEDTASSKIPVTGELPPGTSLSDIDIPTGRATRLRLARAYLHQALDTAEQLNIQVLMKDCYDRLARAYKLSRDFEKSLLYRDKYTAMKDSIFSQENMKKIMQQQMKYDYDKTHLADSLKVAARDKINAIELQRQRSYTYTGVAGALLLLGFSFFMLRNNKLLGIEKKRSDDLLLNILPAEVATELKDTGGSAAKHFDNVTVLFTDFVNFTQAGEKIGPQALIDELHTCFKAFDEITARYNIEKIKTIGDAYLAVAGLPAAHPHHAENMVRAAIEMSNFMATRYAHPGISTFEMRIGLHSGSVVAGIVGVKKFAYDIWGDTVNTAARMEQSSEAGKINISQATYELVKEKFNCAYRGEVEAKGKGKMRMYFVSS